MAEPPDHLAVSTEHVRIVDGGQLVALVVDDDPIVATILSEVLKVHGWQTIVATDGIGALGSTEGIAIDLLVTDQHMPGMTGLDLAGRIRERDAAVPVIVTSGSDDVAALVTGPRTTFVRKPFSGADLMASVLSLLV